MKLSVSDSLVSTGAVAGAVALLCLFAMDIGTISIRANEKPLGTVVFKKMTATRRPSDGLGWERMKNNSPVYDSDTLRTGDLSEAAIYFDDGTSLDLEANSMLKLDFGGPTKNLEFLDGEITVGGSAKGSSYVISSKAGTITVGADSSATFSRDEKNNVVGVEVNKGTATLTKADGTTQTVAENQSLSVSTVDGSSRFVSLPIVPTKPARNARVLSIATGTVASTGAAKANEAPMSFEWLLDGKAAGADKKFTLEIAASRDFTDRLTQVPVTGGAITVPVSEGTWYWRVRDESGTESPTRKFSFSVESLPRPAFPDNGASYKYRKIKPEIRFAWTAMEDATAYLFELSDNERFASAKVRTRVAGTNLSVSDLGEGTWYWRVKPIHGFTEVRGEETPAVRSLTIEKSGEMAKPTATTPFDGTLYQIQDAGGKGIPFAWMPQDEAVSYELVISSRSDLSSPELTVPSNTPYIKLANGTAGELAKAGTWYWGARWLDREGNRSEMSAPRRLIGVDGSIAIRPVFPPDGYRIADSLASNARFSWKSNIAAKTYFLVSKDEDFAHILFEEKVSADTILGKAWPTGTYYWKLRALNADNTVFMETPARSFRIVDPLPGPGIVAPAPGAPFYLREGDRVSLKWQEIPGADYYAVSVYAPKDDYQSPIFERSHIAENAVEMGLGNFPAGMYIARVQAFAIESDASTRVIGYIGESNLVYRRLSYLVLDSPANGSSFQGIAARKNGVTLRYKAENPPDRMEYILWKNSPVTGIKIASGVNAGRSFTVKGLDKGRYYWTVKGKVAEFDISAKETYRFDVLPIPPLPATTIVAPTAGTVFTADNFRETREVAFKWMPVTGANSYAISLFREGESKPAFVKDNLTDTSYTMTEIAALSRGKNVLQVEAQLRGESGEVEQPGTPATTEFTIDLPAVKRATSKLGNTLYGR